MRKYYLKKLKKFLQKAAKVIDPDNFAAFCFEAKNEIYKIKEEYYAKEEEKKRHIK